MLAGVRCSPTSTSATPVRWPRCRSVGRSCWRPVPTASSPSPDADHRPGDAGRSPARTRGGRADRGRRSGRARGRLLPAARSSAPERGGTDFALLDAGREPGGGWVGGWESLRLFSPASLSSLPGWPMPVWTGRLHSLGRRRPRLPGRVRAADRVPAHRRIGSARSPDSTRAASRWRRTATPGGCRALINATGAGGRPVWPTVPGANGYTGRQLHSVDYRRAGDFEGQTVVVVGGGNSGAQIAADLTGRRRGRTVWVTRRPPRFLPDEVDGRTLFALATRRVRAATSADVVEPRGGVLGDIVMMPPVLAARRRGALDARPMFDRLTATGVAWDDPIDRVAADAVVWCTGFRPDLRHLAGLRLTHRDGVPVTDPELRSRSVDDPTLFFLGYGDWCGLASATLIGVGAAARATVDAALAGPDVADDDDDRGHDRDQGRHRVAGRARRSPGSWPSGRPPAGGWLTGRDTQRERTDVLPGEGGPPARRPVGDGAADGRRSGWAGRSAGGRRRGAR